MCQNLWTEAFKTTCQTHLETAVFKNSTIVECRENQIASSLFSTTFFKRNSLKLLPLVAE